MFRSPAVILLYLLCLTGCNRSTTSETASADSNPAETRGTIGVSLMTLTNPFFKVIGDTITAEAAKQGYDTVVLSADEDAAKQDNQVKEFIVKKCAAIVLAPYDSKAIATAIAEADAAGIPVFTVDNGCTVEGAKVVSHVATAVLYLWVSRS